MTSCWLPLVAVFALVASSPVPRAPAGSATAAPSSPLDLLNDHNRSLAPDMADPRPVKNHNRMWAGERARALDQYSLPTNVAPVLYNIELTPSFDDFTFYGSSLIIINCYETTKDLVLHSKELAVEDYIYVRDDRTGYLYTSAVGIELDPVHDTLKISFRTPLLAGGRYRIVIRYVGKLNDDLEGFYRSSYETRDGQTKWLATTQFALAGARRAFPCWDTPEYKARFYITINHDETRGAISNMPPAEQNKNGQLVRVDFDGTLPMSTYLVAFVVSDFASLTNTAGDLTVWARQDIIKGGQFSNDIGERALQLLKEYTGIPYMLPKMDQAAIPDFAAGAMENWGLVTYREEALIEQDTQTIRIVELMTTTICHELGHQWAGNLVTLDWWSHTWLNEGLATYFESFICDQIKPEWHLRDKAVVGDYHFAMESDAIEDQHAMSSSVATANEGIAKFDEISYNKGGAVIRMWEHLLGIDVLKAGLRRFFSLHMFKNAKPEHLFKAIDFEAQKAGVLPAGVSFAEIARTWTEQPGVPVVTAIRDYNERELNLNQERFFYSPPNRALLVEQRWYIPVSVVEQSTVNWSSLKPSTWLSPSLDSRTMAVAKASSSQWILVNPKEIGYYRVNYDLKNWNLLARQLNNDLTAIPPASRAQLVNDALALARAKQLDYPIALQFLDFLTAEREVAPWQAALSALNYLRAKLAGTDAWTNFLTFLRKITAPAFASVGYSGSSDHEARLLRYYVVSYACYAGNSDCIASANDLLKAWLSNDGARLDADTKAVTLCFGLRGLDADGNFEGLKAKWLAETDAATRSSLLAALACAQDDKLTGLLTDAINKKLDSVDQSEILSIWRATLNRPEQTHILFNFAKKNFKEIDSFFNSNAESVSVQLLSNCIGSITSSEQLTEARWWVESNFNGHSGYSSLQKAFLASYISLEWYRSSYEEVADWLVTALSP